MDIKNNVYIWVTKVTKDNENDSILDGRAFDDNLGLGEEKRCYHGNINLVSNKVRKKINCDISPIHFSREGIKWLTKGIDNILETPFLLTSNLKIEHKYSGKVYLKPTKEAEEIFKRDGKGIYPVKSINYLGILENNYGSFKVDLFMKNCSDALESEQIVFTEWDIEAGILKI
jgi:hypothetical protein